VEKHLFDQRITSTITQQEGVIEEGETEKRYLGITVCFVRNVLAPTGISYDGIKGWMSRLSIGFGGMHCFEGISNMA